MVIILAINLGLSLGFFVLAWRLQKLKKHFTHWAEALSDAESALSRRLPEFSDYLGDRTNELKRNQRLYRDFSLNLNRTRQALRLFRIVINVLG